MRYTGLLRDIRAIRNRRRLDGFKQLEERLESTWQRGERALYFEAAFQLCWELHTLRVGDHGKVGALILKVAELVFEKRPATPLEVEIDLIPLVTIDTLNGYGLDGGAWSERRRRAARMLFLVWQRLRAEIDPEYDFVGMTFEELGPDFDCGKLGYENLAPPGGEWPSGTALEAIDDPDVRQAYEKALAENSRIIKMNQWQGHLRCLLEDHARQAERYLVDLYGTEPHDTDELSRLLDQHGLDPQAKTRILELVESRIAGKRADDE